MGQNNAMTALIKDRHLCQDPWQLLDDEADLPGQDSPCIVSLARWQALLADDNASADDGRLPHVGVLLPNDVDPAEIWAHLARRPLLALSFPGFGDGRAYSQARVLRERFGFAGEIRATGAAVTRDQIAGMERCGINAFALREDQKPEECLKAFADFSDAYQPACDNVEPIWKRRRAG